VVFGVHSHSCACLLAVNVAARQVVGTDGVGRLVHAVFAVLGGARYLGVAVAFF